MTPNCVLHAMRNVFLCVLFLVVGGCATSRTPEHLHNDFQQRRAAIGTVAVVPTSIDIVRMNYIGHTIASTNDCATVAERLPSLIVNQLGSNGLKAVILHSTNLVALKAAQDCVTNLVWRHLRSRDIRSRDNTVQTFTFTPAGRALVDETDSDALLFVQVRGKRNTRPRTAREAGIVTLGVLGGLAAVPFLGEGAYAGAAAVGGTAWVLTGAGSLDYGLFRNAEIHTVLLDAKTGEVLWASNGEGDFDGQKLDKLVATLFNTFPRDKELKKPGR